MDNTLGNILQSKKDMVKYDQYLSEMEKRNPMIICKSFEEMFGYKIILHEDYVFEFIGERFYNI